MKFETILFERREMVGIVRLNRPERMNAVIEQMYRDLQAVLDRMQTDDEVRALVLTGTVWKRESGEKQVFCAGADLKEHAKGERTAWQKREYIFLAHETTRRIYEFPKPIIGAINGPARGAGAEMALNCDVLFMADSATIAFPETGLGTFVGGGVTRHLTDLIGMARARHLIYSGEVLDGKQAIAMGLALRSLPDDRLLDESIRYARLLASRAPISMAFAKRLLRQAPGRDLETVLLAESEAILACMNTEDWHEGIASFAQKRTPEYKGR
jgi:enoyl-CoA hydratase